MATTHALQIGAVFQFQHHVERFTGTVRFATPNNAQVRNRGMLSIPEVQRGGAYLAKLVRPWSITMENDRREILSVENFKVSTGLVVDTWIVSMELWNYDSVGEPYMYGTVEVSIEASVEALRAWYENSVSNRMPYLAEHLFKDLTDMGFQYNVFEDFEVRNAPIRMGSGFAMQTYDEDTPSNVIQFPASPTRH